MDGISSALGTSKVKRQQQEIDSLKAERDNQHREIGALNRTIQQERQEHGREIKALKGEMEKIYGWFPETPQLIKWGEYCQKIGFTDSMARVGTLTAF